MQFKDIDVGDMFNTKIGRFVKTTRLTAVSVTGSILDIGEMHWFKEDDEIIVLYCGRMNEEIRTRTTNNK